VPQRDVAPVGAPCWIDLLTSDPDTSRAFYGQLFGWKSEDAGEEYGGYVNFLKDEAAVAGCMLNDGQAGSPDVWTVYLASDDAQRTAESAAAHGGQVIVPAMAIKELGSMAVVTDPGHAAVGVWQPGLHKGFGVLAEPGAPAWFELHTRHYDEAVRFYQDVFGWDAHASNDVPGMRYTTLGQGESMQAGIMDASAFLPEAAPAHWSIYFGVQDTDAALEHAVALGGTIVEAATDTPYGRVAQAADPTGAHFRLVTAGPSES